MGESRFLRLSRPIWSSVRAAELTDTGTFTRGRRGEGDSRPCLRDSPWRACHVLLEEKAVLDRRKLSRCPPAQSSRRHFLNTTFTFHFPEADTSGSLEAFPTGKGSNIYRTPSVISYSFRARPQGCSPDSFSLIQLLSAKSPIYNTLFN